MQRRKSQVANVKGKLANIVCESRTFPLPSFAMLTLLMPEPFVNVNVNELYGRSFGNKI